MRWCENSPSWVCPRGLPAGSPPPGNEVAVAIADGQAARGEWARLCLPVTPVVPSSAPPPAPRGSPLEARLRIAGLSCSLLRPRHSPVTSAPISIHPGARSPLDSPPRTTRSTMHEAVAPNGTCVNGLRTVKFCHTRSHPLKSWLGLPVFNWPLLTSRFPPPLRLARCLCSHRESQERLHT